MPKIVHKRHGKLMNLSDMYVQVYETEIIIYTNIIPQSFNFFDET